MKTRTKDVVTIVCDLAFLNLDVSHLVIHGIINKVLGNP